MSSEIDYAMHVLTGKLQNQTSGSIIFSWTNPTGYKVEYVTNKTTIELQSYSVAEALINLRKMLEAIE